MTVHEQGSETYLHFIDLLRTDQPIRNAEHLNFAPSPTPKTRGPPASLPPKCKPVDGQIQIKTACCRSVNVYGWESFDEHIFSWI